MKREKVILSASIFGVHDPIDLTKTFRTVPMLVLMKMSHLQVNTTILRSKASIDLSITMKWLERPLIMSSGLPQPIIVNCTKILGYLEIDMKSACSRQSSVSLDETGSVSNHEILRFGHSDHKAGDLPAKSKANTLL